MAAFRHIDKHVLKKFVILCASAVAVAALIFLYGSFDPECGFFPACPFKAATGYDCPGCGSQRAIHAILHGRIADAWGHNALMVTLVPISAIIASVELKRDRISYLHGFVTSKKVTVTLILTIIVWTICRNLH